MVGLQGGRGALKGAGGVLVVVPSMAAGVVEREVTVTSPTSSLVKAFTHTIDNIINSNTDHRPAFTPPGGGDDGGTTNGNQADPGVALTTSKAKQKGLFGGGGGGGGGYSRRSSSAMSEDILREAAGSTLTMGIIGCLPDNVQQAIKSFSIRPGKQHITFCFPFMTDLLRKFRPDTSYPADVSLPSPHVLTPGLLFDLSLEVVSGFQSFVTLAPLPDSRPSLPIAVFTLYQRETSEGVLRHFESLIKVLLDTKTLLSVWKMPLLVVELSPQLMEAAVDTCAQTILDIQSENLLNTFPEKTKEELLQFIKEKMVSPNIRTYQDHLQTHIKEVASKLRSVEPERFLSIVDHIRSIGCTAVDYQKADMMMRSPTTDPLIKCFWRIWGQEQIACKVFPIAMASRTVNKLGPLFYNMTPSAHTIDPALASLTHVPIKEGLHSIIKSLKSQDVNGIVSTPEKGERLKGCSCSVCKTASGPRCTDSRSRVPYWNPAAPGSDNLLRVQSAFYRPTPSTKFRLHTTSTPYSDALKAAAILPHRSSLLCPDTTTCDPLSNLRNDFRRSYVNAAPLLPPYWLPSLPTMPPQPPPPYKGMSVHVSAPMMSASTSNLVYPIVYKPKIISQQLPMPEEEIDVIQ